MPKLHGSSTYSPRNLAPGGWKRLLYPRWLKTVLFIKLAKVCVFQQALYTSSSIVIASAKLNYEFTISTDHWNSGIVAKAWALAPYNNGPPPSPLRLRRQQRPSQTGHMTIRSGKETGLIINAVLSDLRLGTIMSEQQVATTGTLVRNIYDKGNMSVLISSHPSGW